MIFLNKLFRLLKVISLLLSNALQGSFKNGISIQKCIFEFYHFDHNDILIKHIKNVFKGYSYESFKVK